MPSSVPDSARDIHTPQDVKVEMFGREPDTDPTFGISVTVQKKGMPKNRLVTIGDSLTHGFQHGAIFNTKVSWPMIVAWELGCDDRFRHPTYDGFGGLPMNIEFIIRDLESRYGERLDWWETPLAGMHLRHRMAEIEAWWETGPGAKLPKTSGILHNLAVYGWDLRDALERTADNLTASIDRPKNNVFSQIVQNHNERAGLRVYESARDPSGKALTAFQAAAELGKDGAVLDDGNLDANEPGIETLAVVLGSNNALGTILSLKVNWSDVGYDDLEKKKAYNMWRPTHFVAELKRVVAEIKKIRARHVILGNIPHVTIAPLARGVAGKVRPDSRYFPFYTRVWITDAQFNAKDDPNLTEQQVRAIDSAIDQYNDAIASAVKDARNQGLDWYVLDICGFLDRLAARRYSQSPAAQPPWWTPYELPPELDALTPKLDSQFFRSGPNGRAQGGLFSLDGVHPTTVAYGLLAQEVINLMSRAGVVFHYGDEKTARSGPIRVDFNRLLRLDTLNSKPPVSLENGIGLVGWLDQTVSVFKRLVPGI